jgi:hypothetical protein
VWPLEHRHNLKKGVPEKSKLTQHAYEEGHRLAELKLGFWKLRETAGIKYTRNWPIWQAKPIQSANPVRTFLPSGSLLSAVKLLTHREDLYDVKDSSWVSIRF